MRILQHLHNRFLSSPNIIVIMTTILTREEIPITCSTTKTHRVVPTANLNMGMTIMLTITMVEALAFMTTISKTQLLQLTITEIPTVRFNSKAPYII